MKISVIIPCHNAESYLGQTIGSVLEQSRPAHEIIVVDDRSTDSSLEVARRFGDRIRLVTAQFGRAAKTRNYGFTFATGDAVMFLDADDVLGPTVLEGLVRELEACADGVALCPWFRLESHGKKWVTQPPSWPPPRRGQDLLSGWLMGRYYPPCCVLWSRAAYERTGGWDEEALSNDDGDLIMRALVEGTTVRLAQEGIAFYRRIPAGQSLSGSRSSDKGARQALRTLVKLALMLEERGRAGEYRQALDHAFRQVAEDCGDRLPEVRAECDIYRRRYGVPAVVTLIRSKSEYWRARAGRVAKRLSGRPLQDPPHEPKEVTCGLGAIPPVQAETGPIVLERARRASPLVSVIIPTYNRAHLIDRPIRSVLTQTFQDFELLLVDDGSADRTEEAVRKVGDPRVRYIAQPCNAGVSAARNRGLRESCGEFVAFLDSDDEWLPEKLERQVEQFRQAPEKVGLIYTSVEAVTAKNSSWIFRSEHRGNVYRKLLERNFILSGSCVMIRRNVIRSAGFFDEGIPAIEDYDLWVRVARFFEFDFLDEPQVRYYDLTDDSRKSRHTADNLAARAWFYRKYRGEMRREGTDHLFLLESAQRHVQAGDLWGGRRLAALALCRRPALYEPYSYLGRILLPQQMHRLLSRSRAIFHRSIAGAR